MNLHKLGFNLKSKDTIIVVDSCGHSLKDRNILRAKLGEEYDKFN